MIGFREGELYGVKFNMMIVCKIKWWKGELSRNWFWKFMIKNWDESVLEVVGIKGRGIIK